MLGRMGFVVPVLVLAGMMIHCATSFVQLPHRVQHVATFMSSSSSTSKTTTANKKTVYQKVVRPPPNQDPVQFLPLLVEYLQDKFSLPFNLPIVYEPAVSSAAGTTSMEEDHNISNDNNDNITPVQSFTSPLHNGQLDISVMGIYTQDTSTIPDMAMVALFSLGKDDESSMMKGLIQDAESKISKALDRGLDDFTAGKIKFTSPPVSSSSNGGGGTAVSNSKTIAHQVEQMDKATIVPTTIVEEEEDHDSNNNNIPLQAKKQETTMMNTSSTGGGGGDFAVQAAAQMRQTGATDFAVRAASKQAQKQRKGKATTTASTSSHKKKSTTKTEKSTPSPPATFAEAEQQFLQQQKEGNGISQVAQRLSKPSWTISSPNQTTKAVTQKKKNTPKTEPSPIVNDPVASSSSSSKIPQVMTDEEFSTHKKTLRPAAENVVVDVNVVQDEKSKPNDTHNNNNNNNNKSAVMKDRKVNAKVIDDTTYDPTDMPFAATADSKDLQDREGDSVELKRAKEAQRVMDQITGEAKDMTPEQLLEDVLKFGEEKKEKEKEGSGFAAGAFDMAKELLQEQKNQRKEQVTVKDSSGKVTDIGLGISDPDEKRQEETPEEELKRLFRAGEQLAESRMERELTEEQNKVVDELVAGDKTISSHARILDDELTELEVRMGRNPDEEFDGPPQNPIFDVMSGPEVYNPNVDPETAVNWPGALPGRKKLRLPKELDDAVKQAKFAAGVITKMREEKQVDKATAVETVKYFVGDRELSSNEVNELKNVVHEAVKLGLIYDPMEYMAEQSRLQIIIDELWTQPEERFREIAENYKDLLLCDNFVDLVKERLTLMADRDVDAIRRGCDGEFKERHEREREIMGQLVTYTQVLLKEARALGAELESAQIEVIRSICKVAMDPNHVTEEESAAALTDAVREMRPMFDDAFVAYLKYAIAEEEGRLARAGLLDDPDECQWLMVLKIVQQGVYTEIARGLNRYLEHIWYVTRMKTQKQRRMLLAELINDMPTLDVRPFVQVVDNIACSLGEAAQGETDPTVLGEMTNVILQLHRDTHELLPPERIDEKAKIADEWAARQKQRLLEQQNLAKKRMQEARDSEHLADAALKRAGESDTFD